ncbi:MAG TPA: biotin/lipoyl-containing protein, partial [Burkholderiales bacterium]
IPEPVPVPDDVLAVAALSESLRLDGEAAAVATGSNDPHSPWHQRHGWRLNEGNHHAFVFVDAGVRVQVVAHYRMGGYVLDFPGGASIVASARHAGDGMIEVELDGRINRATVVRHGGELTIFAGGASYRLAFEKPAVVEEEDPSGRLVSPLPGSVIQVLVAEGDSVAKGQALMIIEAMKMEHTISAPKRGIVRQIYFGAGEQVAEGAQLLELEVEETGAT